MFVNIVNMAECCSTPAPLLLNHMVELNSSGKAKPKRKTGKDKTSENDAKRINWTEVEEIK